MTTQNNTRQESAIIREDRRNGSLVIIGLLINIIVAVVWPAYLLGQMNSTIISSQKDVLRLEQQVNQNRQDIKLISTNRYTDADAIRDNNTINSSIAKNREDLIAWKAEVRNDIAEWQKYTSEQYKTLIAAITDNNKQINARFDSLISRLGPIGNK